jgi:Oxidoreductase molybdopterin binding domain
MQQVSEVCCHTHEQPAKLPSCWSLQQECDVWLQVCAGNRRKEQNMVKKTKGFNWGPAATACSEWTGVRMSVLLKYCGVRSAAQVGQLHPAQRPHGCDKLAGCTAGFLGCAPDLHAEIAEGVACSDLPDALLHTQCMLLQGAHYVCFNGPEKELPQGDTTYGTSLPLEKAMYDGNDILVSLVEARPPTLLTPRYLLCPPEYACVKWAWRSIGADCQGLAESRLLCIRWRTSRTAGG